MSEFEVRTPVKQKLNLDEAFIDTPSPSKKTRREFSTPFKLKIIFLRQGCPKFQMLEIYTRLGKLLFFGSKAFQKCKKFEN